MAASINTKLPTRKQTAQRVLAWKLKMVAGAKGALYPREPELTPQIRQALIEITVQLDLIEDLIRHELRNIK